MRNLSSYDRVMAKLKGNRKETDRVPCINSTSVATIDLMKACDAYWPRAHKNPEKMAKLGSAAHRLCGLDIISIPFCMTVEAETLGAPIEFFNDRIKWPTAKKFIAKTVSDLRLPKDVSQTGRIPVILEAIRILKSEFEGKVPINIFMVPPFTSVSSYLVDSIEFLKWLIRAPEKAEQFLEYTIDTFIEIARLYENAGADIITLHEMGASSDNISPKQFDTFVKPYLIKIIGNLKISTILNICGSTLLIVDKMVECGPNAIAIEERTPIKKAREIVDKNKPGYPIVGNISSFRTIHTGPARKIREAVKKAVEDGVDIVAPGCDFWLETPTKHIKALVDSTVELGNYSLTNQKASPRTESENAPSKA